MAAKLSAPARLTEEMERVGVFLIAGDDGHLRICARVVDGAALREWATPTVLAYLRKHERAIRAWLKTPVDDLSDEDRASLYGRLGGMR